MKQILPRLWIVAFLLPLSSAHAGDVIIDEVMYHPLSANPLEEYVELFNTGTNAVDLSGWRFEKGISFVFPTNTTLAAGSYLVVAADTNVFATKYPGVTNVTSGWTGRLRDSDEEVELQDASSNVVSRVHYADEGDWATRMSGAGQARLLRLTRSGSTATATVEGHYGAGDLMQISGADQPEYNGTFSIFSVVDGGGAAQRRPSTSFSFTVPGAPDSPASGLILCRQLTDVGGRGWSWATHADGLGSSLELVNPNLPNQFGQNWQASVEFNGTPGQANSVLNTSTAPVIADVAHFPAVPTPRDAVSITALIADEQTNGVTGTVFYRDHSTTWPSPVFSSAPMFDDGRHNDGTAGDGCFGAALPTNVNGTIIEFFVEARDVEDNVRTWPPPAVQQDGSLGQSANALYQVDDNLSAPSASTANQPMYRLIMTATERQYYAALDSDSDAEMNGTFISSDADGAKVRHNVGIRTRGAGTRARNPRSLRVNIPSDRRWNGLAEIDLKTQFIHAQLAGSALAFKAGLPVAEARAVQLRVNGANWAPAGAPVSGTENGAGWGTCLFIEPLNGDWAERLMPQNAGGNVYRGSKWPWNANLDYLGTNYLTYVNAGYSKTSNQGENDWSDLFGLTQVLNQVADDAAYVEAVGTNVNVELWMRYFAFCSFINYNESSMCNGIGDDYAMYRGTADPRFLLLAHDFDTILGEGDYDRMPNPAVSIWRMVDSPRSSSSTERANYLRRFMRHPEFAPIYLREMKRLCDTVFTPEQFNPLVEQLLGEWVGEQTIDSLKSFVWARLPNVLSQIPQTLTAGTDLVVAQGYPYTTLPEVTLFGQANALSARTILVNGAVATYSAWNGRWTNSLTLLPGLNRVLVQSLDSNRVEFARTTLDIWHDTGAGAGTTIAGGTLSSSATWLAASGPYRITGSLTVGAGATLAIEAGTPVYLNPGVTLTVANGGRLLVEGTETAPIRFTRDPERAGNWGGIRIDGAIGSPETRIVHAHLEFNGATAIHSAGGTLFLDHLTFGTIDRQYLSLDNSSFIVSECVFPSAAPGACFELVHGTAGIKDGGRGLFLRNFFGVANSIPGNYNDVVDFTGGSRPGPIVQFINNVFVGTGDDHLDLDSTDAWIEGNIFLHAHKNGSPDSSSAISGGNDTGQPSRLTIVGNLIYDCDHAALVKQGNFYTFLNNTIVRQTHQGGTDTEGAVLCLADNNMSEGAGAYFAGNIIDAAEQLTRNLTNALVTFDNNLMVLPWTGAGGGNSALVPLFQHVPSMTETMNFTSWADAQVMREWLSLRPGSPGCGAGPNGTDMGAVPLSHPMGEGSGVRVLGVSISGEPRGTTHQTAAALTVGVNCTGNGIPTEGWPDGSGYTHYRWRLDGGVWSEETPITAPISLAGLASGPHYVELVGRRDSGMYQDDAVYGTDAAVTRSHTWIVSPDEPSLRLNEVLASNRAAVEHQGTYPDLVELFNAGAALVDLGGMGLTDDPAEPFKFVFPAGTVLDTGDYLNLYADNNYSTPGLHLGFALAQAGGGVYLLNPAGQLVDSLEYGCQLTDVSVGRLDDGTWGLAHPTFGAANRRHPTGEPRSLLLNEWLADGETFFRDDFLEVVNLDPYPVDLGGCFLTDNPLGWPDRHPVAPLTFIAANGYFTFIADGETNQGVEHLDFRLRAEQGMIGLFDPALHLVDCVYYEAQRPDISQGRSPSGSNAIAFFSVPTPGGANPVTGGSVTISNVLETLLPMISFWRYERNGVNLGTEWRLRDYDDSAWPSGLALLGVENTAMAYPLNTDFPDYNNRQVTYYFRTSFEVETSLVGVSGLSLTTMLDDGAVIYLNDSELHRIRLPEGPIDFYTIALSPSVGDATPETFPLSPALLRPGTNHLAVEVHQRADPDSSDVVWGMALATVRTVTNISQTTLFLNEVMANNQSLTNEDGTATDWVELYNPTDTAHDLSGLSLTDDPQNPQRWLFPTGASIAAQGYLVVRCDPNAPQSTNTVGPLNAGFGLKASGDRVYLYGRGTPPAELDSIAFGLQAPDLPLGRVPDGLGGWTLCLPTAGMRNLAAALGNPATLKVNEWMADPLSGDDWFELFNPNSQPVAIGSLHLTDDLTRRTKYRIPPHSYVSYGGRGYALFAADDNTGAGADHTNFRLAKEGESIGLFTASGIPIDAVTFGLQTEGISEGRLLDGATNWMRFANSASPGSANYLPLIQVVINEALAHSDPPFQDAIELHNLSGETVDISGWWVSDEADELKKFRIPDGTVLTPDGYRVLYEYEFNPAPFVWPAFAFSSANGDQIHFSQADPTSGELTGHRAVVSFGPSESSVSLGRHETSVGVDFVALSQRTFGVDEPATTNEFIQGTGLPNAYPKVGPIVISEIMYHPPDLGTNNNTADEYLELHNITSEPVPLFQPNAPARTWHLRGGVDFNFPTNIIVQAGSYLLVVNFDPANPSALAAFRARYEFSESVPVFGPYQGNLANDGEGINVNKPDEPTPEGDTPYVLIERVSYSDSTPWPSAADGNTNYPTGVSLQRRIASDYGNDPVNWIAGLPTPGTENGPALMTPPAITLPPTDQLVVAGSNVTFTVVAIGAAPLHYQWQQNGAALPDATNATLAIDNAQPAKAGRYTVLVSNPSGAALSAAATLTVLATPEIVHQPQSRSAIRGSTATFAVSTRGYAVNFQWRFNEAAIPEATNSVLVVSNVQTTYAGRYDVIVWNAIGSVTSTVAMLTVLVPPEILVPPQDATVVLSNAATFSVVAAGTPPLRYQWRFDGANLPLATNAMLEIPSVTANHEGFYDVRVWSAIGVITSTVARLTVFVPPTATVTASGPSDTEPGSGRTRFMFTRTGPPTNDLSVFYTISGSATPGQDYQTLPGSVLIRIGAVLTEVPVQVLDDALTETPETVVVALTNSMAYLVGTPSVATVTILDDENQPPTAAITNPPDGQFYPNVPAMLIIEAQASDPDGIVSQVEFFNGTNKLGETFTAPFTFVWTNPPAGSNDLTAIATDNLGAQTVSSSVIVIINLAPTVAMTNPPNNSVFEAPVDLLLQAVASDSDGTVTHVSFYDGTSLLGAATAGPVYSLAWTDVPVGSYALTAVAIDNWGVTSTSSLLRISVLNTNFADLFLKRGTIGGFTNFLTANNTAATFDPNEPAPFSGTGTQTLWITWTAPTNGWCTIDTIGSTFDTVLSVYTNAPPNLLSLTNLVLVGGDDDSGGSLVSLFTFYAWAGTAYHIRVAGFSSEDLGTVRFHLSLATPTAPPSAPALLSLQAVSVSQVSLRWSASTNRPDGYWVERSFTGVGFLPVANVPPSVTAFLDTRLDGYTTYFYRVRAYNSRGSSAYSNTRSCTSLPMPTPFAVRINFGSANAPVPLGWEADDGDIIGTRFNCYLYGWYADNRANGRVTGRGVSPYDSFQNVAPSGGGSVWELAVAEGHYAVRLVAGSADEYDGFYSFTIENALVIHGQPSAATPFLDSTNIVWVGDWRLTIASGEGATNNRITFVEISAVSPPMITAQPVSRTVPIGSGTSFAVQATGTPPLSYQWCKDGLGIAGATNPLLTLHRVTRSDVGAYVAVVSSPYGAVTSAVAVLSTTIRGDDLFENFEPGLHEEEWSGLSGTYLTTNWGGCVSASRALWFGGDSARSATTRPLNTSGGGVVDFQLRLANGAVGPWEIPDLRSEGIVLEYSIDNEASWVPIGIYDNYAFTNWTHVQQIIPLAAQSPFTVFRWRQMAHSGADYDHWALDDVLVLVTTNVAPAIRSQPQDQVGLVGTRPVFTVGAVGSWPLNYQWRFNGTDMAGETNAVLVLSRVSACDAGLYSVMVSNALGVATSRDALLHLDFGTTTNNLLVFGIPNSWKYYQGGALAPEWAGINYDDSAWPSGGGILAREDNSAITPYINTVLNLGRTTYYFRTRFVPPTLPADAEIVGLLASNLVDDGAVFYLNDAELSPRLRMPAGTISASTFATMAAPEALYDVVTFTDRPVPGTNLMAVEIHQNQPDSSDIVFGMALYAILVTPNSLPLITSQPASQSVTPGSRVTFAVGATGTPSPRYQWRFNGNNLVGRTSPTLLLNNAQLSHAGQYTVVVSNIVAAITSSVATLTVQVPPSILTQPQSQTVFAGTNVTLLVTATGALPLVAQWRCDGVDLPAQTNTVLVLSNIMPSANGCYNMTITNTFGSATTTGAVITVIGPIITSPRLRSADGVFTLECSGHAGGRFQLECSTNLLDWNVLETVLNPQAPLAFEDRAATNSVRFYRLRWEP